MKQHRSKRHFRQFESKRLAIERKEAASQSKTENISISTGERSNGDRDTSDEEIRELLSFISADCGYTDWCNVLMGLHDHYGGSATGLGIADDWSATDGVKYKRGEVSQK